jgi:SAM-dependent methyltransferase
LADRYRPRVSDLSVSYGRIADRYEEARGGQRRADELVASITPWLPAGGRLLEVGAGTGIVAATFRARGFETFPMDLSPEMLDQAAARFPARRVQADAVALPYRSGALDGVAFVWSLHHIAEPEAALREAARVVRRRGRIVVVAGPVAEAPDDEIKRVHDHLNETLRPGRIAVARDAGDIGAAAGLARIGDARVPITYDASPNQAADAIEAGLYSHVWDLDDATWARVVEPAIAVLRALPDPDAVRTRQGLHPLIAFQVD